MTVAVSPAWLSDRGEAFAAGPAGAAAKGAGILRRPCRFKRRLLAILDRRGSRRTLHRPMLASALAVLVGALPPLAMARFPSPAARPPAPPGDQENVAWDRGWRQYRGRPDHNNYRKVRDTIRVPMVLWRIDRAAVPAAVGEDVYAGGSKLRLVDLKTGKIKASWQPEKADDRFEFIGTPVVLEDRVIAHARDAHVYALDRPLSKVLWSAELPGLERSWFSAACDGEVYVVSAQDRVVALKVQDGKARWTFKLSRKYPVQMSPAIADGKALFGAMNGTFYAVDVKDGKQVWTHEGDRPFGWTDPVVAFGKVFVGDRGGFINAIDLEKGTLVWSLESGATGLSAPGVFPGKLLVGFSKFVATIDVKSGKFDASKGGFRTGFNPFGSPTLIGKTLCFGNLDGHLYAFDYKREKLKWAFEVGEKQQVLGFIYHRGILLAATTEGLYALGNNPKKKKLPKKFVLTSPGP